MGMMSSNGVMGGMGDGSMPPNGMGSISSGPDSGSPHGSAHGGSNPSTPVGPASGGGNSNGQPGGGGGGNSKNVTSMGPSSHPGGVPMGPSSHPGMVPMPMRSPLSMSNEKVYPLNTPMVFNPQNPNAPPIYPCRMCRHEVHDNDQAVLCESGCNFWFHRTCAGLTEPAFHYLTMEIYAEWVCQYCLEAKDVPLVKFKP
jgi:hypothetical protein